jgi:hypothetical protein
MKARLYVAGVLAAVALVLVLAVVVLQFGISQPSPPSLRDHPRDEIPGSILHFDLGGCIVDAAASGRGVERVICPLAGAGYADTVTWIDEQTLAYAVTESSAGQSTWHWVQVDLVTKRETTLSSLTGQPTRAADPLSVRGERVSLDPDGYLYRDSGGDRVRIYELPSNQGAGQFEFATWSPDGEWFLLRYYPKDELWIIRRDGSVAGTLASDVRGGASWIVPGVGILPRVDPSLQ